MGQATTPNYGWPYPDSADPVKDGATRMGNLAKAIDTTFKARIGGMLVQGGSTVVTTNAGGAAVITFPVAFGTQTPGVSITGATTAPDSLQPQAFILSGSTNSGFVTANIKNQIGNGWIQSTAVRLFWTAIGAA